MSVTHVHANAYTRTQTAIFVSDKLENLMKKLVLDAGLDPTVIADSWTDWLRAAARKLLESGYLEKLVIEFYHPGAANASGRWDFPIRYDGNGGNDMWVDTEFFKASFIKAPSIPAGCTYRVLLVHSPGAPDVGLVRTSFKGLGNLTAREAGTVIATPDVMASAVYYK